MCNPFKAITRAVDPIVTVATRSVTSPGSGDRSSEQAQLGAQERQTAALNAALLAQQQAQAQAQAASDTQSESARMAAEARLRKIASAGAFGSVTRRGASSDATPNFRSLFGAA